MAIEFVVFLEDDATEEEQRDLANELSLRPEVIGVYRYAKPKTGEPHERIAQTVRYGTLQ